MLKEEAKQFDWYYKNLRGQVAAEDSQHARSRVLATLKLKEKERNKITIVQAAAGKQPAASA